MAWDVIGHDWAVDLLRHDLKAGRLAHAYLFTGVDGIGKRTLALALARAVNCLQPPTPGDSCGKCRPCRLLSQQRHPDLHILCPEGPGRAISVDAARALTQALALKPLEARYRMALLLEFHRANASAANALLKTIEEPPPAAVLILTAESIDSLLPTVVSRCRILTLRPIWEADVIRALIEYRSLPPDRAQSIARRSGGRIGWALAQADDPQAEEVRHDIFLQWRNLFRQSRAERFAIAQAVSADREEAIAILRAWQAFSYDLLLHSFSSEKVTHLDFLPVYRELAAQVSPLQARAFLLALRRAEEGLDRNANARLAVEAALLDVPDISAAR